MPETGQLDAMRAEISALREEVERLKHELAELREYIGEVPCMECGITSFEEWQKDR
jgi:prefoldin subunit 5